MAVAAGRNDLAIAVVAAATVEAYGGMDLYIGAEASADAEADIPHWAGAVAVALTFRLIVR